MEQLRKKSHKEEKFIIGWNELVDLPEWGIFRLKAKVDTGACSSAIHVEDIKTLLHHRVRFYVVLSNNHPKKRVRIVTQIKRQGKVRPSHGVSKKRIFVKTTIQLGPVTREIELNLVDREKMNFRMLIGRSAFGGHFLVDAAHSRVQSSRKKPKKAWFIRKV